MAGFIIAFSVPELAKCVSRISIKFSAIVKLAGSGRRVLSSSREPRGRDRMVVSPSSGGADAGAHQENVKLLNVALRCLSLLSCLNLKISKISNFFCLFLLTQNLI